MPPQQKLNMGRIPYLERQRKAFYYAIVVLPLILRYARDVCYNLHIAGLRKEGAKHPGLASIPEWLNV